MIAAVLDHLWQSTLFAGGAGLLTLMLRDNGAQTRFWLWFAASMKFLIPFAGLTALASQLPTAYAAPLAAPTYSASLLMQPVMQPFSAPAPVLVAATMPGWDPAPFVLLLWGRYAPRSWRAG